MSLVVPDACTLRPSISRCRLGEVDELFATAVRQTQTLTPTHARMALTGEAKLAAAARTGDRVLLVLRPHLHPHPAEVGEALTLDIEVPAQYADVLVSLVQRASTVSTGRTS